MMDAFIPGYTAKSLVYPGMQKYPGIKTPNPKLGIVDGFFYFFIPGYNAKSALYPGISAIITVT